MKKQLNKILSLSLVLIAFNNIICFGGDDPKEKYLLEKKCSQINSNDFKCNFKKGASLIKISNKVVSFAFRDNLSNSWTNMRENFDLSKFEPDYYTNVMKTMDDAVKYQLEGKVKSKKISACYIEGATGCKRSIEISTERGSTIISLVFIESQYKNGK